jgi:hypothetical protein
MSRVFESVKYNFSDAELQELGAQLAREAQGVFDLEEQKKSEAAAKSAQLKEANGRVAGLTTKINNGYELREVECLVLLETPRPGLKQIVRIDTNEVLRVEPMTKAEMQSNFGFQEPGEEK